MSRGATPYISDHLRSRFKPEDLELIDAFIVWCERRNLSPNSTHQRVNRMAQIADFYPDRRLFDLEAEDIELYFDSLRGIDGGAMKASSRKTFASIVRIFYKWATDYGHTDTNPMTTVINPKVSISAPHPISEADYTWSLQNAPTPQLRLWLLLGGAMGLRVAEIASLRWEDVDFDGAVMRVTGKGDKTRSLPMPADVVDALRVLHEHDRTSEVLVFADRTFGEGYSPATISKHLARFFRESGMKHTAHSLRHRFGTEACESSGDIRAVQVLMGHTSIEMTARYTQVRDKRTRSVVDGMRTG